MSGPVIFKKSVFLKLVVFCCFAFASTVTFAQTKTVSVAYYLANNYQLGRNPEEMKAGYSYEFLQNISNYTGWKYDYVYGDWGTLYEKFLAGEIDLFPGFDYENEFVGKIEYPPYYMEANRDCVFILKDDSRFLGSSYDCLSGKKIGCVRNHFSTRNFSKWIALNKINAQIVYFSDFAQLELELIDGNIDGFVSVDKYVNKSEKIDIFTIFSEPKSFLGVRSGASDIYDELSNALKNIFDYHPEIITGLNSKYYRNICTNANLSDEEKEWVSSHDVIRVGYIDDYFPFCATDENGEVTGVLKDIFEMWSKRLDLGNKVKIEFVRFSSSRNIRESLENGSIDVSFPETLSSWHSEQLNMTESREILDVPVSVVFTGEYNFEVFNTIAITRRALQQVFTNQFFPNSKLLYVDSVEACLNAVKDGRATCTILSNFIVNPFLKELRYSSLKTIPLENELSYCFGVKKGDMALVSLLNRGIGMIDQPFVNNLIYAYADSNVKYTVREFLQDNIIFVIFFIFLVIAIIIFMVFREIRKDKIYIQELESARETGYMNARKFFDCFIGTYLVSFQLNLEDETFIAFGGENSYDDFKIPDSGSWESIKLFLEDRIHGEDKKTLVEAMDIEYIRSRLKLEPRFIVMLREVSGGSDRWLRYEAMRIKDSNYVAIAISDVTGIKLEEDRQQRQLREAYQMAQSADRAKTMFLNNMSHDIRTPMNAIIGFTTLASTHIENKSKVQDYLKKISISSGHLLTLINDILDMTRIESGKVKIEEKEMSLPAMLQDLKAIVQPIISAKELGFYIDTEDVVDELVFADRVRLNQVLLNIIGNAVKFTSAGGNVSVRIIEKPSQNPGYADYEFHIKDTGIGIAKEFQEHVFEAFSREKSSTVSGIQGAGLGMAITKNIVDMMGGTISVESEVGKGSEFTVSLRFKLCNETPKYDVVPSFRGLRALVVDDDSYSCTSISKMLKGMGMRSEWTLSGKEGVLRTKLGNEVNDEYHVFIVDWVMEDSNGLETVKKIRELVGYEKPVILMSAYDFSEIEDEAKANGVTNFLSKPVFMNDLRNVLTGPLPVPSDRNRSKSVDFTDKRVLLVEDNELNQEIAKTILEESGFIVDVVNDGIYAVERILESDEGFYDIILMDVQMPKMNGYDATKQIRKMTNSYKDIPIIAMTANAFDEDIRNALNSGMNGHIAKPINVSELLGKIKSFLS